MPLFKIHTPGSRKILIRAETIIEIIETAKSKFKLDNEDQYQLILEDGTEVDDNDIILELSQTSNFPLVLTISNEKLLMQSTNDPKMNLENDVNILNTISTEHTRAYPSTSKANTHQKEYILNMDEMWKKVPDDIVEACKNGERLLPKRRQELNRSISAYMINTIKMTTRGIATEIARNICEKYPSTFKDNIGNQQWGSGHETLMQQIYNCSQYMKQTRTQKRILNPDSDDDENERRNKETQLLRHQDEYGCVAYAPKLPDNETSHSQETARLRLLQLFDNINEINNKEIDELMKRTYSTQRAVINDKARDLQKLSTDWPFLKIPQHLIAHSSVLLGKEDIKQVWENSLNEKIKRIRQTLKFSDRGDRKKKEQIIDDSKIAIEVRKDKIPKVLVVFQLLVNYFAESEHLLFKVINNNFLDCDVAKMADTPYPVLIVRGNSIYDEEALCTVIIDQAVVMFSNDALEGILITVLSYFVYGIEFPKNIEETLEFIQRVFLDINPPSGGKHDKKRRKGRTFNTNVYNLAKKALSFAPGK